MEQTINQFIQRVASIPEKDVQAFVERASRRTFEKKELFVCKGQTCRQLLFIRRGIFRYYLLHDGKDHTKDFAVDQSNRFCTAFTSFITQTPSQIYIEAVETSDVLVWPYAYIRELFDAYLPWQRFARRMAESMYIRKEKREIAFLTDSAEKRYLDFIAEFPDVVQRVPQHHIASYLGITPESLSRLRKNLAENNR